MTTSMLEGALISYDEMEHRVHRARQVRAEFLGGCITGLLEAAHALAARARLAARVGAPLR